MKKSKLLQGSKDLLHRSFNPAKCKTSLKLAGSRLKLLRNKKEVQVRQMKREIAQILESGQDQTARIRVEHVIREEKMMAAYDLIEIYCELIVARLSIIESQKNCPIDLKEAITSLIFASPRCGDIPELLDVRKQLTAKYGKDFSSAAIELKPACGVSRMLVEKLSAAAPDLQTKNKILTAIAEENNVKWDSGSVNDEVALPPSDLLNGPGTFGKEGNAPIEPSHSEYVQASSSNNKMHNLLLNSPYQDPKTTVVTENVVPAQASGASTAPQRKERPMGDGRSQSFQGNGWNMEFKDAASAAEAAAESAERASMAARAAAELSNRDKIMRQHSYESNKSADDYVLKEEGAESYANLKPISEERVEKLPSTKLQNEHIHGTEKNDLKTHANLHEDRKEHSLSGSSKLKASSVDDLLDHDVQVADGYSMKNSSNMNKKSFKNEAGSANVLPEKHENIREERKEIQQNVFDDVNVFSNPEMHMEKQSSEIVRDERVTNKPSVDTFHSHSGVSDEDNIFSNFKDQGVGYAAEGNPFISMDKVDVHEEVSHESASASFAKYDSDNDYPGFDIGTKYDESQFHLPLPSQKSTHSDLWAPSGSSNTVDSSTSLFFTRKNSFPEFSEDMMSKNDTEVDNFARVKFDDSDGPTFDDEADDLSSEHIESGPLFKEKRSSAFNQELVSSSDDELKTEEIHTEKRQGKRWDSDSPEKLRFEKSSIDQPKKSLMETNDFDSGEGLNFGKLTGGFRHKGNISPRYIKNPSLLKESTSILESSKKSTSSHHKEKARLPAIQPDSDGDSSEEEVYSQKVSGRKQIPLESKVKPNLHLRAPKSSFISGNSDSDDDAPKESPSTKNHHRAAISRRTKTVTPNSGRSSYSKMPVKTETPDSDIFEIPKESEPQNRKPSQQDNHEQPTSSKVASKPVRTSMWNPPETFTTLEDDYNASGERKQKNSTQQEIPKESEPRNRKPSQQDNHEQPTSSKVASKPVRTNMWDPPETFTTLEDDYNASGERKQKTSTQQEIQSSRRKSNQLGASSVFAPPEPINSGKADSTTAKESEKPPVTVKASISSESSKGKTSNKTSSSKEDSNKKASHVHPKLPDYDSLVQSLRRS